MNWYQVENAKKSVRQVVVEIPPGHEKDSKFGMMFFGSKYLQLMTSVWIAGFFRMDGDPGPYLLIRGDGAAGQLRGSPLRVAFSFYRMRAGGLMAIFVEADSPTVRQRLKRLQLLFETFYGLDQEDTKGMIRDAVTRDALHLCFAEGDGPGEFSGGIFSGGSINAAYDVVVPLPSDCRAALKREWEGLLGYHSSVPAGRRSFEDSGRQMQAENPATENTILPRSAVSTVPVTVSRSIPGKRWWEIWK